MRYSAVLFTSCARRSFGLMFCACPRNRDARTMSTAMDEPTTITRSKISVMGGSLLKPWSFLPSRTLNSEDYVKLTTQDNGWLRYARLSVRCDLLHKDRRYAPCRASFRSSAIASQRALKVHWFWNVDGKGQVQKPWRVRCGHGTQKASKQCQL